MQRRIVRKRVLRAGVFGFAAATLLALPAARADSSMQPRMQNGIPYVTGGVGEEQQSELSSLAGEGYNLKLVFAERGTGAYLADVHVIVADARGRTLLDAMADGPAFFAKLPDGSYTVTAEHRGMRQSRKVRTGRSGPVALYWPGEGGSAPEPADVRAPHAQGGGIGPAHAGQPAGSAR